MNYVSHIDVLYNISVRSAPLLMSSLYTYTAVSICHNNLFSGPYTSYLSYIFSFIDFISVLILKESVWKLLLINYILCSVYVLLVFVLCTQCCQFLWIVHFDCPYISNVSNFDRSFGILKRLFTIPEFCSRNTCILVCSRWYQYVLYERHHTPFLNCNSN